MPTVLFAHDKPRSAAKVGPLLKKKGIEVREMPASEISKLPQAAGPRPEVVVVDAGEGSLAAAKALISAAGSWKGPVLVTPPPSDGSPPPPGVRYAHGGRLVDEILSLLGEPAATAGGRTAEHIVAGKIEKVLELRRRGIDPYPPRFSKKDPVSAILEAGGPLAPEQRSGRELATAGRVVLHRVMGKAAFFHIQDASGRAQVYAKQDALGESGFAIVKHDVQVGDFVGVAGEVFKTKTGEPTLWAKSLTILAKALRPLPEKWHGLKDVEARYRSRHLDLVADPEVRALFEARSRMVDSIRGTFRELGFLEVETPILLQQAGGAAAAPFKTFHRALGTELTLRIATELYLKRLIIGGYEKVYEIGRIFRNEGIDTRHNPEFTMLEAYAAFADYNDMAALFEGVLADAARALAKESVEYRGKTLSLKPPFRRLRLPELWKEHCGEDIHEILQGKGFNRRALMTRAGRLGVEAAPDAPSAKIFERVFDARILPQLQEGAFVFDHPTAITPLAKCKPGDESLVERFEFFLGTEEIANAYTELNDPLDQRERFEEQRRQREGGLEEAELLDEDFVQAMECGMPPTGGIGIGIDRLAMVFTGHPSIREVILFPTLKPE